MKKLAALFLALVFMCSFVTAGQAYPDTSLEGQSAAGLEGMQTETFISLHAGPKAAADGEASMLVVYFSMPETTDPDNMTQEEANSTVVIDGQVLGNTQYVACLIEEYTGADIFRIEPEIPYPTDHDTLVDLALEEQNSHARPALAAQVENIEDYDVIFLGYPKMEQGYICV